MANIKLGWQMNGLKDMEYDKVLQWASKIGIESIELQAWPNDPFCNVDEVIEGQKEKVLRPLEEYGIEPATLVYCVNLLAPNEKLREEYHKHFKKVVDAADILNVPIVSCFVGSSGMNKLWPEMAAFEECFLPLLDYAEQKDIKLAIENCPSGGNNIANNPKMWETLIFEAAADYDNLGLEFDPSHLVWLHVDWAKALDHFLEKGKIFCCHAKDTKIDKEALGWEGIMNLNPTWKKAKMPGMGDVDWKSFMKHLKKHDFEGSVLIEHEDPDYRGKKYQKGVELGFRHLKNSLENV